MVSLNIRKIDKNAYEQLRIRAEKRGVSIEEEARQIICLSIFAPDSITNVFQKFFGKKNGVDLDSKLNPSKPNEPTNFEE